jgi:DNA-binding CsgD family transcriptional regulator
MPHISRALSLRREFIGLQTKLTGLQGALDHLAAGIVLLDPNGRALFANTAIRAMARRNDGLSLDRAGFPIPAAMAERQRFDAMIAAVLAGGPGGTLRVSRKSDAQPYAVLVSPAPTSLLELNGEQRAHAGILIVVHDPSAQMRTDPALLQDALGLTPGAAKLVTALAGDDDLKSFAEREGITIHTARFHLRTALARTGTRTQAQLVRLAVRLLAELRLRSTDR